MDLQGYFDDSGSHKENEIYVLAGFISTIEKWEKFNKAWRSKLDEGFGLRYFKMSEAMSLTGQFASGWTSGLRDQLVLELSEIIKEHVLVRVDSVVFRKDYEEVVHKTHPSITDPYFVVFYQLVFAAHTYQLENKYSKCELIFDEQGNFDKRIYKTWREGQELAPTEERKALMESSPLFRDDKKNLPLQAADLYAWMVGKTQNPPPNTHVAHAAWEQLRNIEVLSRLYDREALLELAAKMVLENAKGQGFKV